MFDIISFVEEVVTKYDLEKNIIEDDIDLKNELSDADNYSERAFIKYLYSKKLEAFEEGNITPNTPSEKLRGIIEKLIDKKISVNDLPTAVQESLRISAETANKIVEDISKNKGLNDEIAASVKTKESESPEEKPDEEKKGTKSIGSELLK
ncbi:MAG: hypothetical protein WC468_01380 [Candidatus Paceibacterota bacterium]